MICHIDFKCISIDFHKQIKWQLKYQHLGVGPLIFLRIPLVFEYPPLIHPISYLRGPYCLCIRDFESGKK